MHGSMPKPLTPQGQLSARGLMELSRQATQFGISGGFDDTVGSQGVTPKPQLIDACFALVDDYEDNRHAWTEADVSDPSNPVPMNGGRRGTIAEGDPDSDDQPAWDLNGESHSPGEVIYVVRITYRAWGIICCNMLTGGSRRVLRDVDLVCDDETGSATLIKTYE